MKKLLLLLVLVLLYSCEGKEEEVKAKATEWVKSNVLSNFSESRIESVFCTKRSFDMSYTLDKTSDVIEKEGVYVMKNTTYDIQNYGKNKSRKLDSEEVLNIRNNLVKSMSSAYWKAFEDTKTYYEVKIKFLYAHTPSEYKDFTYTVLINTDLKILNEITIE